MGLSWRSDLIKIVNVLIFIFYTVAIVVQKEEVKLIFSVSYG